MDNNNDLKAWILFAEKANIKCSHIQYFMFHMNAATSVIFRKSIVKNMEFVKMKFGPFCEQLWVLGDDVLDVDDNKELSQHAREIGSCVASVILSKSITTLREHMFASQTWNYADNFCNLNYDIYGSEELERVIITFIQRNLV